MKVYDKEWKQHPFSPTILEKGLNISKLLRDIVSEVHQPC